jgi:hypothetical protein
MQTNQNPFYFDTIVKYWHDTPNLAWDINFSLLSCDPSVSSKSGPAKKRPNLGNGQQNVKTVKFSLPQIR